MSRRGTTESPVMNTTAFIDGLPTKFGEFLRGRVVTRPLLVLGKHFQVRISKAPIDSGNEAVLLFPDKGENNLEHVNRKNVKRTI